MRVGFCEMPCGLLPGSIQWGEWASAIAREEIDLLVLNEMPFGPWLPLQPTFDPAQAGQVVALHEKGLHALQELPVGVLIGSRPLHAGGRLANEAFALIGGQCLSLHQKHYFPEEEGFFERTWFVTDLPGFAVHDLSGTRVGVQMCTELMFNEWSRRYGRSGAQIIAVPRTSGVSTAKWQTALAMTATVSGCFVVSSNRSGQEDGFTFGGRGFLYAPGGALVAQTSPSAPLRVVDIDLADVVAAQADWPCNVPEFGG